MVPTLTDFGAVGDDFTMNDAAFAAWIIAAQNVGVGYVPPGTFRISAPGIFITRPVRIYGAGEFASKIRTCGTGGVAQLFACVGPAGGGSSLVIEDLAIIGPISVSSGQPFTLVNNSRAIIRRCRIDAWPRGIWVSASYACIFEQCTFTNLRGAGISFNSDDSANGSTIRENSFFACGNLEGGYAIDVPSMGYEGTISVLGNDIEGCWSAMRFQNCSKGKINGNWMEWQNAYDITTHNCGSYPEFDTTGNFII